MDATLQTKKDGFTLIELLVVIAIIALLLAILMPTLKMAKEHGRRLLCATNLKTVGEALYVYAGQNDDELPMNLYQRMPSPGNNGRRNATSPIAAYYVMFIPNTLWPLDPAQRLQSTLDRGDDVDFNGVNGGVTNLGYLLMDDMIEMGEVFYCPSNKSDVFSYKGYGGGGDWPRTLGAGFGGPWNPRAVRSSYSYLPQSRTKKHPSAWLNDFPDAAYKQSQADPSRSVMVDVLGNNTSMAHKSGSYTGCNMLYGDASVLFRRNDKLTKHYSFNNNGNYLFTQPLQWREMLGDLE